MSDFVDTLFTTFFHYIVYIVIYLVMIPIISIYTKYQLGGKRCCALRHFFFVQLFLLVFLLYFYIVSIDETFFAIYNKNFCANIGTIGSERIQLLFKIYLREILLNSFFTIDKLFLSVP